VWIDSSMFVLVIFLATNLLANSLVSDGFSLSCKGFVTQHGRLSVSDSNQLIDSFGDKIHLRGLSSSGFGAPPSGYRYACVSKESISYAVLNYGINLFRLPILISATENGYETNAEYYDEYIDDVVSWCEDLDIYVIIDWHVTSPGDPNYWLDSPGGNTGLAIDFWKKMATAYHSKSHVIYEIANEPSNVTWSDVLLYHNSIIQEIRAIDSENLIIAGTTHWSQDIDLPLTNPVALPKNVLYSFHFYASSHGYLYSYTAQYVDQLPLFVTWSVSESSGSGSVNFTVADNYLELFAAIPGSGGNGPDATPLTVTSWVMSSMSDSNQSSSTLDLSSCTQKKWTSLTSTGEYINSYLLNTSYFIQHDLTWCNDAPTGQPTGQPSSSPTISFRPTGAPSGQPTGLPTSLPSSQPSSPQPTQAPTLFVKEASTRNGSPLSAVTIVGLSIGGIAVLLIAFLIIGWVLKSTTRQQQQKNLARYQHSYQTPAEGVKGATGEGEGGIDLVTKNSAADPEAGVLITGGGDEEESGGGDGEHQLSTAAIYSRHEETQSIGSHDVTVAASHSSPRGRETNRSSPERSMKRPSHSPPPSNPLHQNTVAKKRESRRGGSKSPPRASPVPQGSKKKRNSSRTSTTSAR
jgi:hypothetical protein